MKRILLVIPVLFWVVCTTFAQSSPSAPLPTSAVVPSGTHMLMQLVSPLNTVSATDGSAVFLEVTMPVIADNHIVIPAHTHVTGTVLQERRPGRVKRVSADAHRVH
jgi:limonene-1,2-epoxide hydrolase